MKTKTDETIKWIIVGLLVLIIIFQIMIYHEITRHLCPLPEKHKKWIEVVPENGKE